MLQRLQPSDHRFDPRTHLFVLLQESGALAGEGFMSLAQGAVLLTQLFQSREQLIDASGETSELGFQN